jgi:hypothetical protein
MIIPGPTNTKIWGKDMPHLQKPEDTFPTAKLLALMEKGGPTERFIGMKKNTRCLIAKMKY